MEHTEKKTILVISEQDYQRECVKSVLSTLLEQCDGLYEIMTLSPAEIKEHLVCEELAHLSDQILAQPTIHHFPPRSERIPHMQRGGYNQKYKFR
jgi:hypothetical protein